MGCALGNLCCLSFGVLSGLLLNQPMYAQVVSDSSVGTTVTTAGSNYTIGNGTQVGSNLFHSFSQFSVPTGGTAYFNNVGAVQTIFARVTGGNVSNIDGVLKANGTANLFLINPAGILFGANAQLNLGGSFVATTANSIRFADGTEFSATNGAGTPLLTVSVPLGLQMGSNPAPITVQGTGHNLTFNPTPTQAFPPFTRETNPKALTVQPGKTLALVGGTITLNGGQLLAEQGRIELGSVGSGQVSLSATSNGFALGYAGVSNFRDIQLAQAALVDASGPGSSGIYLTGRQVSLTDGSTALVQNWGTLPAGDITVQATESLKILGTAANGSVRSSLSNEAISAGAGGAIQVSTRQLTLQEGGQIVTRGFGAGDGGNITINASEFIDVLGSSSLNPAFFSSIFALTPGNGLGQAGDVTIATGRVRILNGGIVTSSSFGLGSGGNLTLQASDKVEVIGKDPVYQSPSDLNVATYQSGNAGSMTINTQQLVVKDGAKVRASTLGSGNAGRLTINAGQLVEVGSEGAIEASVNTTTFVNQSFVDQFLGIRTPSTGKAGGISISSDRLFVHDGAKITVENVGPANGGTLQVNAGSIFLDRGATLTASTKSGEGGNIFLQGTALILRHGSLITTNAGGNGNGGNITIYVPVIAGFENSDIVANAVKGRGGNIQITTKLLLGLKFRSQLTPENDITASSQFGLSGTVQVNDFDLDPTSGLVQLPTGLVDSSQQIASGCTGKAGNSFVATGRGGLPPNPTQDVNQAPLWIDTRNLSAYRKSGNQVVTAPVVTPERIPIEATTWQQNPQTGEIELIAAESAQSNASAMLASRTATCARAAQ